MSVIQTIEAVPTRSYDEISHSRRLLSDAIQAKAIPGQPHFDTVLVAYLNAFQESVIRKKDQSMTGDLDSFSRLIRNELDELCTSSHSGTTLEDIKTAAWSYINDDVAQTLHSEGISALPRAATMTLIDEVMKMC